MSLRSLCHASFAICCNDVHCTWHAFWPGRGCGCSIGGYVWKGISNCSRESQWWLASWMDMPAVKSSLGSRFIDSIENQEWRIKIQISNPSVAWCVLQWSDSKNDSKHFVQWVQCSPGVGCSKQLTLHRKSILEQLYDLWSWAGRQWKILNCSKWFSEMTVLGRLMFSQIFASMCTASMK